MKCFVVGLAVVIASTTAACGEGDSKGTVWNGNGHTYSINRSKGTWEAAQASAAASGGHLVTITSADEEQFIVSTFLTGDDQLAVFWMGCSDKAVEDTFVWVTGEPFSYTNWKSGEPNGWDGEGEDYCCINWNAVRGDPLGQWNDTLDSGLDGLRQRRERRSLRGDCRARVAVRTMPQPLMTPQLQMAIKMLQISRTELVDMVREKMLENPILEASVESANEQARVTAGRQHTAEEPTHIAPDVYVHKVGDEYVVVANDDGLPKLRSPTSTGRADNGRAPRRARTSRTSCAARSGSSAPSTSGSAPSTRSPRSIVKFQRDFFDKGIAHLKPLILRDVAEDIGMHESTVSRVTTNKYVHTPQGIFELKYFFNSA